MSYENLTMATPQTSDVQSNVPVGTPDYILPEILRVVPSAISEPCSSLGGESRVMPLAISEPCPSTLEGESRCPLCASVVRLYFINYHEKLLMCGNIACEFPFGHEDLQIVRDVDGHSDLIVSNTGLTTEVSPSATSSFGSSTIRAEIEKLNQVCISDDECEARPYTHKKRVNKNKQKEDEIRKHIQEIKSLNLQMSRTLNKQTTVQLKNGKWLKKLKSMQELSGVQLLKPGEIEQLKREEPDFGIGELKIDIAPASTESMSSIKIEIHNRTSEKQKKTDTAESKP